MPRVRLERREFDGERHLQEAYAVLERAMVDTWLAAAGHFAQAPRAVLRTLVRLNDLNDRIAACPSAFRVPHCLGRCDAAAACACD